MSQKKDRINEIVDMLQAAQKDSVKLNFADVIAAFSTKYKITEKTAKKDYKEACEQLGIGEPKEDQKKEEKKAAKPKEEKRTLVNAHKFKGKGKGTPVRAKRKGELTEEMRTVIEKASRNELTEVLKDSLDELKQGSQAFLTLLEIIKTAQVQLGKRTNRAHKLIKNIERYNLALQNQLETTIHIEEERIKVELEKKRELTADDKTKDRLLNGNWENDSDPAPDKPKEKQVKKKAAPAPKKTKKAETKAPKKVEKPAPKVETPPDQPAVEKVETVVKTEIKDVSIVEPNPEVKEETPTKDNPEKTE